MDDEVVGGYFDAGDYVKLGFPMASMTTVLAWGGVSFYAGYDSAGLLDQLDECLRWSLDYFMAAHISDHELVGQVGDGYEDHAYWGRPEEITAKRPAFRITEDKPGSDLAGETAAALAAGSLYFSLRGESGYAEQCLSHAKTLFNFAEQYRGSYVDSISQAADFYNSWNGYHDELVWAAAWLAKATTDQEYTEKAVALYTEFDDIHIVPKDGFSWDTKVAGCQLLLWEITEDEQYKMSVEDFLNYVKTTEYTPAGLVWLPSVSQWSTPCQWSRPLCSASSSARS